MHGPRGQSGRRVPLPGGVSIDSSLVTDVCVRVLNAPPPVGVDTQNAVYPVPLTVGHISPLSHPSLFELLPKCSSFRPNRFLLESTN
jgi:hypothetical protein